MFKSTEQGERRAWAELRLNNEDNFLLRLLTSLMNLRAEVAVSRSPTQHICTDLLDVTRRVKTCYQERMRCSWRCNLSPLLREEFGYSATRLMCRDNPRYRRYQGLIRANSLIRARDKARGRAQLFATFVTLQWYHLQADSRESRHLNGNENCRDWK